MASYSYTAHCHFVSWNMDIPIPPSLAGRANRHTSRSFGDSLLVMTIISFVGIAMHH